MPRPVALISLLAAVAVAFADSAIVVLALPELLKQYDVSINEVAWVVTGYNVALALGALVLVPLGRRIDAAQLALGGAVAFGVASLLCAVAPDVWPLIVFRVFQGFAAAALLVGALPVLQSLSPARGAALWAGAGVFGAALGPALGGALTEIWSWRAIFYAQAPVAALAVLALIGRRARFAVEDARPRSRAGLALAFASAALVGLLFLAVVQLVDVWRLSPLEAGAVVSVIPLATLIVAPLAARSGKAAVVPGAILMAGGLAGMAFLPARNLAWVVVALGVAGFGFGLAMPTLTRSTPGATAVWIRHAGLVVGLILVTPLLTTDLTDAANDAKLRGIATVLGAPIPGRDKIRQAADLVPILSHPPRKELPDFSRAGPMGAELNHVVQATVTRAFRRSYLLAALFAAAAALTVATRRALRAAAATAVVGLALLTAELAAGARSYGTQPKLYPACADRPADGVVLEALDFIACRAHKSREELVATAAETITIPDWLLRLLRA